MPYPGNYFRVRVRLTFPLMLISFQEAGRRALWSVNGPRILQVGYEDEEDPKVMEAYEQIGSLVSLSLSLNSNSNPFWPGCLDPTESLGLPSIVTKFVL